MRESERESEKDLGERERKQERERKLLTSESPFLIPRESVR